MTIYVPEDLAELVKGYDDLNVSAVCQAALRQELARREELATLDKGMKRVEVFVDRLGSDVAFVGKEVYRSNKLPERYAYITKRHRIAIYDPDAQELYQFDTFDELADDEAWKHNDGELVAAVAAAVGEKHVMELDI